MSHKKETLVFFFSSTYQNVQPKYRRVHPGHKGHPVYPIIMRVRQRDADRQRTTSIHSHTCRPLRRSHEVTCEIHLKMYSYRVQSSTVSSYVN